MGSTGAARRFPASARDVALFLGVHGGESAPASPLALEFLLFGATLRSDAGAADPARVLSCELMAPAQFATPRAAGVDVVFLRSPAVPPFRVEGGVSPRSPFAAVLFFFFLVAEAGLAFAPRALFASLLL